MPGRQSSAGLWTCQGWAKRETPSGNHWHTCSILHALQMGRGAGDGGGTVTPRVCRSWTGGGTSQGDRGGSVAARWVQKATRRKCLQWGAGVDRGEGRGLMAWAAWRPQDHRELSRARRWPRPLGAGSGEMGKRECGPRQRQL